MTPQQFIQKWQDNTLTERAGAQAHFLDLCELIGVDKPSDPENYCFERGAKKTGAGRGWADVWKRNHFAWEYKAPGVKLEPALKQLMMYALALDNPPLLVVSDRLIIEIHTHFTGRPSEVHTILIADIAAPANLQKLKWLFTDPEQFKPQITRSAITIQAARLFGDLAWAMQQRGHEARTVAHFLNKILFCLFAESTKSPHGEPLLPERLFSKILANGQKDITRFEKQLKNLFSAMSQPHGEFGLHLIDWFNGGLFDDDVTLPLKHEDITQLIGIASLDWSAIDPSIFGTLFERGLNPKKRSQLGAHYTDPVSIMRIVGPVIIEPLLAEWNGIKAQIATHMDTVHALDKATKPSDKTKATNALKEANKLYLTFLDRLEKFRILDPACGSGNFLYLGLQALKDIEHRAGLEVEELGLQRNLIPHTGPQNVLGIELDEYAAELARVTVWIGEIQWMTRHGYEPSRNPILKTLNQIECRDALMAFPMREALEKYARIPLDERIEEPRPQDCDWPDFEECNWPASNAIIGNPPFLGDKKMRAELGDSYTEALRKTYAGRVPGGADLVCYWFDKARSQIKAGHALRAGLVATNSLRGGANRKVLDAILQSNAIYNAWSDEEWVNEGAAVRVSLICFTAKNGSESGSQASDALKPAPRLDDRPVAYINSDLTATSKTSSDLTHAVQLSENASACFVGVSKKGKFEVEGHVAREWLASANPHGKSNADVVHPVINGADVVRRYSDTWIVDFYGRKCAEAELYELPFKHVVDRVKPIRDQVRSPQEKRDWWLIARNAPPLRRALTRITRYAATSIVAKHRLWVWFDSAVLPEHAAAVVAREDDVVFGVVHSRLHDCWSLRMCTWLGVGNDPRYTPTTCFETYPFPESMVPADTVGGSHSYANSPLTLPHNFPQLPQARQAIALAIANAAYELNKLREAWLNPPEWVDVVPEVVPGYPDRIIPKPEFAKAIKERTLTNLYNQRPAWLAHAHEALDEAVAKAYGWDDYTPAMSDDEILARLLKLNLERASHNAG